MNTKGSLLYDLWIRVERSIHRPPPGWHQRITRAMVVNGDAQHMYELAYRLATLKDRSGLSLLLKQLAEGVMAAGDLQWMLAMAEVPHNEIDIERVQQAVLDSRNPKMARELARFIDHDAIDVPALQQMVEEEGDLTWVAMFASVQGANRKSLFDLVLKGGQAASAFTFAGYLSPQQFAQWGPALREVIEKDPHADVYLHAWNRVHDR